MNNQHVLQLPPLFWSEALGGGNICRTIQSRHLWILQWFPKDYWSLMPRLTFLRFPATSSWWLIKWHFPIGTNIVQHSCLCLQFITCLSFKTLNCSSKHFCLLLIADQAGYSSCGTFEIPLSHKYCSTFLLLPAILQVTHMSSKHKTYDTFEISLAQILFNISVLLIEIGLRYIIWIVEDLVEQSAWTITYGP